MAAPFDNTLVLGQLLDPKQIKNLEDQAAINHLENTADQKLRKLMLSERKLTGIHDQMKQFIDESDTKSCAKLDEMGAQLRKVKQKIGKAVEGLIDATIEGLKRKKEFRKNQADQKRIGLSIGSPIDFALSSTTVFPLSSDGMDFDVQYFRNESNKEISKSKIDNEQDRKIASTRGGQSREEVDEEKREEKEKREEPEPIQKKVSDFVQNWLKDTNIATQSQSSKTGSGSVLLAPEKMNISQTAQRETANSVQQTMSAQTQNHDIEGTLVIVASCTHKNADIISPCIMDPVKILSAWNETFPDDKLSPESHAMFTAALELKTDRIFPDNALHLLTGCTRASSFVGMAHILRQEKSDTTQSASNTAKRIRSTVQKYAAVGAITGQTTANMDTASKQISTMMSSSNIFSHCSLVTKGIIPNIVASDIKSTVKTLNPSPVKLLQQMKAIKSAGDSSVDDLSDANLNAKKVAEARTGAQFLEMSNNFAKDTVAVILKKEANQSKVIDTKSMLNAFTDYIKKAQEGNCGIPVNFFIKKIDKGEVARTYINVFYPSGVTDGITA